MYSVFIYNFFIIYQRYYFLTIPQLHIYVDVHCAISVCASI